MQIKTITSQHRRDFYAVFLCEHCQHEETRSGYDDAFFHNQVIPQMQCKNCGKTASDDYRALAPKHAETDVV
jgi:transcription elongation factor Elf1